ncbi:MAG: DUF6279 family lipoprotein [Steroidobacteraceae bacterium]
MTTQRVWVPRWVLLVVATMLLTACGGVRFFYDRLDMLLPWYLGGYVELEPSQRSDLERRVDVLLAWHRSTEIRRYAAFFRELEAAAERPVEPGRFEAWRREAESYWQDLALKAVPEAGALLASLSDTQVRELMDGLREDQAELAEDIAKRSPAERLERRRKSLEKQFKRWLGRLEPRQLAMIDEASLELETDSTGWLSSRSAWTDAFERALEQRKDPRVFPARLRVLLVNGESTWPAAYRRSFEEDRTRVIGLMADIDRSLTPRQRQHLRQRLGRWAADLEAIAADQ